MIIVSLTFVLFVLYAGLLLYYLKGWQSLAVFLINQSSKSEVIISVIIPARNEEQNLPNLLKSLQAQTYGVANFEVIIVDDHSTDDTGKIVSTFPMSNLHLVRLADHVQEGLNSYKKKAIEVAIIQSKGELIVTTDADCIVNSNWLETIAAFYAECKPSMIIMPVAINSNNSFISIFQSLDFMTLQGVTGGAVHQRLHAMCNGANLAYTRQVFDEVNGFAGIDSLASGDDMLLMNKIQAHKPDSIRYLKSKNVIVSTEAMPDISAFLNQRIRWASKTSYYNHKPILISAAIVYFFNVALLVLPIVAIFNNQSFNINSITFTTLSAWFYLLAAKIVVELFFLFPVARFFKQQFLLYYFPFMQPFHILYTVMAGALGKFGSYEWKGRKVK